MTQKQIEDGYALYKHYYTKALDACAFMHDDKRLKLPTGIDITSAGVTALKGQRDKLFDALTVISQYQGEGGPATPWQQIVREITQTARDALK